MLKNSIKTAPKTAVTEKECRYMAGGEEIRLTPDFVRNYLVSGDPSTVTFPEIVMFMNLCKYQHLNPFLREAYLIKYGSQPATIVTGKSALEKRAVRNSGYKGFKAGVIVITKDGKPENRTGTLVLNGENLVGGWCDVFVDGLETVSVTVSMAEYVGRKKDGSLNQQWASKPATMIRKVAKMQALREAFPEDLNGMYSAEEMGVSEPSAPPVTDIPPVQSQPEKIEPPPETLPEPPEIPANQDDFAMILEGFET